VLADCVGSGMYALMPNILVAKKGDDVFASPLQLPQPQDMRTIRELEAWESLDKLSDRDVGDGFQRGQFVLDSVKEGGCILVIHST
jgi:hypothetical protein